jgi:hypothetical protein
MMTYHNGKGGGAHRRRVWCGPYIDTEKLGIQGSREEGSAMWHSDSATAAAQP